MNEILTRLFGVAGKHVVVTGGSRGIGRMIADGFVEAGCTVYITARKADACDAAAEEMNALGGSGTCISLPGDLSTKAGIDALVAAVGERTDRLHVLVNNAGATWGAPLDDYPEDGWDKVVDINLKAPFLLAQAFAPLLRETGTAEDPARIINVASMEGLRPPALESYAYSSSKAGVLMLTRHLGRHLVRDHVLVNAIAPGPFESKMMAFVLGSEEGRDMVAKGVPARRIGQPDDMAAAAIFLAGPGATYLVGNTIVVDGGLANVT